mmetsp:Transcript_29798/g.75070  ORF Transcript_29798/g.75070 Transcript_29798/m.75070 type:complete len:225 (-) Transcript_29798:515-1189(-)
MRGQRPGVVTCGVTWTSLGQRWWIPASCGAWPTPPSPLRRRTGDSPRRRESGRALLPPVGLLIWRWDLAEAKAWTPCCHHDATALRKTVAVITSTSKAIMTTRAVTKGMTFVSSVAGAADSRASWAAVESGVPATRTTSPRSWWCSAPMTISLPWTQLGGKSDAFTLTSTCTRLSPSPADFDGAEPIVGLLQFPFPPGQSVITCSCKPIKVPCNVSSARQLDHH